MTNQRTQAEIVRQSLKRRYRKERRFRLYGMTAIAVALLSLVVLFTDIIGKGYTGGKNFDLSLSSMKPLEPFRKYLTIVSDTDCRNADAFSPEEIGGDHFRTAAVFLTQAHPKQTQGSDVHAGTSFDQVYAKAIAGETPIPSIRPVAVRTATPASTRTPSPGRRPPSRSR